MYILFIKRFTEEITEAFKQLDFWLPFIIFNQRKLPTDGEDFNKYGVPELDKLSEWYGEVKTDHMNQVSSQPVDMDLLKLKFG